MDVETNIKHKFMEGSNMSFQEVYDFAFKYNIPIFKKLAKELGEDQFLETLKKVGYQSALQLGQEYALHLPCNDLAAFTANLRDPDYFWKHVLAYEIVEDTPQAFEVKVTECLWAKTFREIEAAEIGYLLSCYPDYASCQGFNPKITMTRSKTIMQGDNYCNHRWVWEG